MRINKTTNKIIALLNSMKKTQIHQIITMNLLYLSLIMDQI